MFVGMFNHLVARVYSIKEVGSKNQKLIDSLINLEYLTSYFNPDEKLYVFYLQNPGFNYYIE